MDVPNDRKYLETHEWHLVDGNVVTIGITQFAADQLSDVTYVELPVVGSEFRAGRTFGEIESVKATSELYTGVSGKLVAVNEDLADHPELVNSEPYQGGWMVKIEANDLSEFETLLSAQQYEEKYSD